MHKQTLFKSFNNKNTTTEKQRDSGRRKMEIIEEKNLNTFLLIKQLKSKLLINKIKLLQPLYVYDHYAKK